MAKTYEELLEQAAIIRDETAAGKNTATRVGGTITDAVDYVKELQDTYKGIHAEAAEAKTTAAAAKQTAAEAKTNAGAALSNSQGAVLTANAANATANAAKTESAQAVATAQAAKDIADSAKQTADAANSTANAAKTESAQAVATAQKAQTKNAEQDNRLKNAEEQNTKQNERLLNYVYPKLYQLNEGAGALPFDGMYSGSASVLDGRKTVAEDGCTYKVVFASGKFLLLEINQDGEDAGLYEAWDKIISGRGSSEDYTIRDCLYYIYVSGEGSTYYYIDSNGKATEQSATYLLRRLVDKNASSIADASGTATEAKATAYAAKNTADAAKTAAETAQTTATAASGTANEAKAKADAAQEAANTAQQTAAAAQTKNAAQDTRIAALLQDTPWEGQHMNAFTETGEYHIHGDRTDKNDGLPILNEGSGHTIEARLTVLDSSLTNGTGKDTDIVVTQILRLSNRTGGDGHVYVRTAQASTKSQLATPSSTAWGTWEKLMGIFEKNAVSNATDLNEYTSSGMYDGMFVFSSTSQTAVSGLKIENGSTFLMVSVNGYAVAQTGVVPQVTQLLYVMPSGLDGSSGVRNAKVYTRTGIYVASTKTYTWGKFDGLAQASDITKLLGYIQDNSDLIQENQTAITANTKEIARVNSTATRAQETADRAQETANTAQTTADSASSAAAAAQTTADNAQETANNAQTKNNEQDTRLEKIENIVSPLSTAGRYWNEANGTPTAAGHYGSLDALRSLPEMLGLGRYLVKDDRTRRKLDPKDSTKYADDGTDAKLDGTEGQCMWCWNGFYANVWKEGDNLFKVVSFDRPVGNDISIWIPAGGISWMGAGVIERGEAPYTDKTKWKLCSVINNSKQFRGGGGIALDTNTYTIPPANSQQITMLGMPATNISTTDFGTYARKRGEGWEANWFVARFVVEFLFEIIMGTENSQEAFNANKDADGLYQGGFGTGVTDMTDWVNYNGTYPLIPTSVGLEAGDGVCIVEYKLPQSKIAEGDTYKTFNVPVFFGLVGAGYGHLWQWVRGLIMDAGEEKSLVYVAPSMYAAYDPNTVAGKIMVAECPRVSGWITRKSYKGLCCMPTEIGGSPTLRYSDLFNTNAEKSKGLRVRAAGGYAGFGTNAGASCTHANSTATLAYAVYSAPLCYFEEDPIIPLSQSIATNS